MRSMVRFRSLLLVSLALLAPVADAVPPHPLCGDETCAGGKICRNKVCVCPTGLDDCDGTCRDLTSNPKNCGECKKVCTGARTCQKSLCACPQGFEDCAGTCRNLAGDSS